MVRLPRRHAAPAIPVNAPASSNPAAIQPVHAIHGHGQFPCHTHPLRNTATISTIWPNTHPAPRPDEASAPPVPGFAGSAGWFVIGWATDFRMDFPNRNPAHDPVTHVPSARRLPAVSLPAPLQGPVTPVRMPNNHGRAPGPDRPRGRSRGTGPRRRGTALATRTRQHPWSRGAPTRPRSGHRKNENSRLTCFAVLPFSQT